MSYLRDVNLGSLPVARSDTEPQEVVSLNHRLLEEISQVQLRLVDVMRENFRLRSEIDELRRPLHLDTDRDLRPARRGRRIDEPKTLAQADTRPAPVYIPWPPRTSYLSPAEEPLKSPRTCLRQSMVEMEELVAIVETDYHIEPLSSLRSEPLVPEPRPVVRSPFMSRLPLTASVSSGSVSSTARSESRRILDDFKKETEEPRVSVPPTEIRLNDSLAHALTISSMDRAIPSGMVSLRTFSQEHEEADLDADSTNRAASRERASSSLPLVNAVPALDPKMSDLAARTRSFIEPASVVADEPQARNPEREMGGLFRKSVKSVQRAFGAIDAMHVGTALKQVEEPTVPAPPTEAKSPLEPVGVVADEARPQNPERDMAGLFRKSIKSVQSAFGTIDALHVGASLKQVADPKANRSFGEDQEPEFIE